MRAQRIDLQQLAARIRLGDAIAAALFVREFERQFRRFIRRQLQTGNVNSQVDRRIASTLDEIVHRPCATADDRERLIGEATARLSRAALESIRSNSSAMETIVGR